MRIVQQACLLIYRLTFARLLTAIHQNDFQSIKIVIGVIALAV